MEPENEIDLWKLYIKECYKRGLRGNNCNYPHPAPCKKYIKNPECRCTPECANYHPDTCKYSMQFRKCNNVKCYKIHLYRTMRQRSQKGQHQALSHRHINQFHNISRSSHSTFANKPHKTNPSFNPHISTRTHIHSYSHYHNQIPPSHTLLLRAPPPKLLATLITKTQSQ